MIVKTKTCPYFFWNQLLLKILNFIYESQFWFVETLTKRQLSIDVKHFMENGPIGYYFMSMWYKLESASRTLSVVTVPRIK